MKETFDVVCSNFKKKLKKWLVIISILIIVIIILAVKMAVDSAPSIKNPNKYANYKRYDYHLECIAIGNSTKIVDRDDFDGVVRYAKIYSVSEDQFVCLRQSSFLVRDPNLIVLQNPDNYVDVFNEWTVKKMELTDTNGNVINTLTEQDIIDNFKEFINSEKTSQERIEPWSYFGDNKVDVSHYNIRIYYEESENIYWEIEVSHYTSNGYGEYIYARQVIDPATGDDSYASIANYPEIYNWLSECFENIDA